MMTNQKNRITDLKSFLDEKTELYNNRDFIADDPISIPHMFSKKEDREISGFITATISWGNRKSIVSSARNIIQRMDGAPYVFVMNYSKGDKKYLKGFVHRTFNENDLEYFVISLQNIYRVHGSLETTFGGMMQGENGLEAIQRFRKIFFEKPHASHVRKHVSDPSAGSAAKRLNMFLRWMVRADKRGVDFGIWKNISPGALSIPLDVHSGNVARALGMLNRKQNDWKAVSELDTMLRSFDPSDPVKYDFALFGLGAIEKIMKPQS
jgi:uncharacterized protein (TIGR02757 family)